MNNIKNIALGLLLTTGLIFTSQFSLADEDNDKDKDKEPDYIMDTSKIGTTDESGTIRSEQLLELGSPTSSALSLEGETALRMGGLDRALTVFQRSVEMAPLDMDNRILYAQTLEKKLMSQKDKKDPKLYNFIIKQWYFVYKKAEFVDQTMLALNGIAGLTGTQPKRFENPQKFFARVLIPEDGSVKVAIGGNKPNQIYKKRIKKDDMDPDRDLSQSKPDFPE